MRTPVTARYGTWPSSVSAHALAQGSVRVSEPRTAGPDRFWLEQRPDEGGRVVLVRLDEAGDRHDVTPREVNARSRVHEYGGGAYAVADGIAYVCGFADTRVHRIDLAGGGEPTPLTAAGERRYADLAVVPDTDGPLLVGVREDHTGAAGAADVVNTLVRLRGDAPGEDEVLVSGADFYASPRPSPDGRRLAWVQWDHPNMPWDATELWVADLTGSGPENARRVAGGPGESVCNPTWSPAGALAFASDRTGYWNLHLADPDDPQDSARNLLDRPHDFCGPAWMFGFTPFCFLDEHTLACRWYDRGISHLGVLDLSGGDGRPQLREIDLGANVIGDLCVTGGGDLMLLAGFADRPGALLEVDTATATATELSAEPSDAPDPAEVSAAEAYSWTTPDGETAHGWFYPPLNPAAVAPAGTLAPLIVMSHGGPTAMATPEYRVAYQYWTSRGFAVLDVNYRGSTGYGRAYRERLKGSWGIVDVDDCTSGALALADAGRVDRDALLIRGGSAGGYTTLAALTFRDVFAAGASYFGVSDITALVADTHKFESRYIDSLVGAGPGLDAVMRERSPIHHTERLTSPMILLQGADDAVVPPNQAELMADALRTRDIPVELIVFPGEGHGFRKAETIVAAAEAELGFYRRVLGAPTH